MTGGSIEATYGFALSGNNLESAGCEANITSGTLKQTCGEACIYWQMCIRDSIIGCLDVPTSGTYLLDGQDVGQMDKNQLAAIRNKMLGFIFQQYNLLPKLTLQENVAVPLMYAGVPKPERHERSKLPLEMVGLGDKLSLIHL